MWTCLLLLLGCSADATSRPGGTTRPAVAVTPVTGTPSTTSSWGYGGTPTTYGECVVDPVPPTGTFDLSDYDLCGSSYYVWYDAWRGTCDGVTVDVGVIGGWYDADIVYFDAVTGLALAGKSCTDIGAYCNGASKCGWSGPPLRNCSRLYTYTCDGSTGTGLPTGVPAGVPLTGAPVGADSDSDDAVDTARRPKRGEEGGCACDHGTGRIGPGIALLVAALSRRRRSGAGRAAVGHVEAPRGSRPR